MSYESEREKTRRQRIRNARSVEEAVQIAASYVGLQNVDDWQAKAIAEAARDFADNVVGNTQMALRFQWEQPGYQDHMRQRMRHELLDTVTRQGLVPVELPSEKLMYRQGRFGLEGAEVPEEAVNQGADWDEVQVMLRVRVRTPPVDRAAAVKAGILAGEPE